jgi:hypothetical protein
MSGQPGRATETAILGLIDVQKDLHTSIVRLRGRAHPRGDP